MQDHKLENYLRKLLEIQENQRLAANDLKALALSMGMGEDDWQAVRAAFSDHVKRGMGYLQHKHWEDAIAEFNEAHALDPYDTEVSFGLAQAYRGRWGQTGDAEDQQQATLFAKNTLDLDPGHLPSFELLAELKTAPAPKQQTAHTRRALLQKGSLILLVLAGVVTYFALNPNQNQTPNPNPNQPPAVLPLPESPLAPGNVPLVFVPDARAQGLNLRPVSSEFTDYAGQQSFGYRLRALISHPDSSLTQLSVRIELIDEQGAVLHTETRELIPAALPLARPGDLIPLGWDYFAKEVPAAPKLKETRISLVRIARYGPPRVAPVDRLISPDSGSLPGIDVEIRERSSERSHTSALNRTFQKAVWELKNTGNLPIELLKLRIEWLGSSGQVLASKESFATTSSLPPIEPGETRVWGGTWGLDGLRPEAISDYRLVLIQAK